MTEDNYPEDYFPVFFEEEVERDSYKHQAEELARALAEARPYVYNVMQASDDWRSETAQDILSRIDPALKRFREQKG